jgi:hypothetical protein
VEPTRHALERSNERDCCGRRLRGGLRALGVRDLAIAGGWLPELTPGWSRLYHDAPLYAVVGRLLCMPLRSHPDAGRWEPTTVVTEHEPDSWTEALDQGCVRLVPAPPEPPGELPPAELAHPRLAIGQQARVLFAVTAPPAPPL